MFSVISKVLGGALPQNSPKFMIIGAQKAGSTALYDYLSLHPQLIETTPKELHYFNCDKNYSRGDDYYHSLFPQVANENEMTFDSSPSYLCSELACRRIRKFNSKMKFIVLVREPVARAYSAWNMYRERYEVNPNWFFDDWVQHCCNPDIKFKKRNVESLTDFKSFVEDEIAHIDSTSTCSIEAPIIPHGFYCDQISHYLSLFNKNQILIIENENFLNNKILTLRKIEGFLKIDSFSWDDAELTQSFVGNYDEKIDDNIRNSLSLYYSGHNERLFKLIGKRYAWNNQ